MAITPHIHIGFIEFIVFFLYLIIGLFLIRAAEVAMHSNSIGQALSFIH